MSQAAALSRAVSGPTHVPESAVYDFDMFHDPAYLLGSHLARIELQTLYEQMLARLPPFRLDPDHPPKFHGGHVIGIDTLCLLWDV